MRMSIKTKIVAGFGVMIALIGASSFVALRGVDTLKHEFAVVVDEAAAEMALAQDIFSDMMGVERAVLTYIDDAIWQQTPGEIDWAVEETDRLLASVEERVGTLAATRRSRGDAGRAGRAHHRDPSGREGHGAGRRQRRSARGRRRRRSDGACRGGAGPRGAHAR
jgi:hypothetical protein